MQVKKLYCLIALIAFITLQIAHCTLHIPIVLADYNSAYNDYTYKNQQYKDARNKFLIARSTYQTYKTLTSQNDAIAKFKGVLQSRDDLISSYYDLLQEKLNSTDGVSSDYKNTFKDIRTSEKDYLSAHQKKITDASTIDDLNEASTDFEKHDVQMDIETKQALGNVLTSKESVLKSRVDSLVTKMTDKTGEIRSTGEKTEILDRGLITVANKLDFYNQSFESSKTIFAGVKAQGSYGDVIVDVFKGQQKLTEANGYLREAVNTLKEMIRSITGDI